MLSDEAILVLGENDWATWRMDHEVTTRFARDNSVVFVERFERYEVLRRQGRLNYAKRFFNRKPEIVGRNLVVLPSQPMLPFGIRFLSRFFLDSIALSMLKLSGLLHARSLQRDLRKLRFQPTVTLVHWPWDLMLLGRFDERVRCYTTYDEVSLFLSNRVYRKVIDRIEQETICRADLVFASSRSQYEKRLALNPSTYLVPNGVDFEHFNRALAMDWERPEDLQGICSPIVGFVGIIDYRFDFDLVREIAVAQPDWSVVLVGFPRDYAARTTQELGALPNVYLTGQKEKSDLPRYLHWFDVALIPYRITVETNTMYPWKIHQYLAAGLPVVSTPLHELLPFRDVVRLVESPEDFIAAIEEELQDDSRHRVKVRVEVARANSWESRLEQMSRLIEQELDARHGSGKAGSG